MNLNCHILLAYLLRLVSIRLGDWWDKHLPVAYTDIDYTVFTDAAAYVLKSESPYRRDTYRYSPILAYMLVPNFRLSAAFGKVLFSLFDCLVAVLIARILSDRPESQRKRAALIYLYNPLSIVISTRGNCDSIIAALVLLAVHCLQKRRDFRAAVSFALAVHFRLYPIAYSLLIAFYLLRNTRGGPSKWSPIRRLARFAIVSAATLGAITAFFYASYGYEFLYETYLYHLQRKDTKHNFSVYFYLEWLAEKKSFGETGQLLLTALKLLPKAILIVYISCAYSKSNRSLNFGLFLITYVFVIFNSVLTSQYFVWILALVPINMQMFRGLTAKRASLHSATWTLTKLSWLLPAYLVEFRGLPETSLYPFVWIHCVLFFVANISIICDLIERFA